jgi:hypothetical protein
MARSKITAVSLIALMSIAVLANSDGVRRSGARRVTADVSVNHPDALVAVGDCEDLRSYMTDVAVERLVEYLYLWWWHVPWSSPGSGSNAGPSDYSSTNVQEEGVDELDIVKTNGTHVYVTTQRSLRVARSWPAPTTAEIASLPTGFRTNGLFLSQDRALTVALDRIDAPPHPTHGNWFTKLQVVDVSNPSSPWVERTIEVEGWLIDARRIEGDVYLVVQNWISEPVEIWAVLDDPEIDLPELPDNPTWDDRLAAAEIARGILRPHLVEIIDGLPNTALLPHIRDRVSGSPDTGLEPLIDCDDVLVDPSLPNLVFTSIVHLDLGADDPAGGDLSATSIAAQTSTLYASGTTLYLVQPGWSRTWTWDPHPERTTTIHAFDLDPDGEQPVSYAAVGEVPGYTFDQFALSEHDGHLRVATQDGWWWNGDEGSRVTVLARSGANLTQVGSLSGIAPGERLYAVRFVGDVGFAVTFEQIDPLFTIDLSDPTTPEILGELEVTGFSTYLHPVDGDQLLALGLEIDPDGNTVEGLAVSWFDVSDLQAPALFDRLVFSGHGWSWSEALYDHHAITYHRDVLSFPRYRWTYGQGYESSLAVIDAVPGQPLLHLGDIPHDDLGPPDRYNRVRRSVVIEDWLYSISDAGMKVTPLRSPNNVVATVEFSQE